MDFVKKHFFIQCCRIPDLRHQIRISLVCYCYYNINMLLFI